jgi:HSP20 family protein
MERLEAQLSRLEALSKGLVTPDYPPLNVWASQEAVIVLGEIPGVDPFDIDISVEGQTLKLWGCRQPDDLENGEGYRRRERDYGQFNREFDLPFAVDVDNVEARFSKGVLFIKLPRAAEDTPKRIFVESA